MNAQPSICFVAPRAFGALAGALARHAGGVERQQAMIARWFAARGWHVSMITWDEGGRESMLIDGVRLIPMCRKDAGIAGLRFFHPRWTSLRKAMHRADAQVYYYNLGDMMLGQVAHWCRPRMRRCVYAVASNPDCDPRLPVLKPLRERVLYRYGLRHADKVIVQTSSQQRMLTNGFGIDSTVLPMPCFAGPDIPAAELVRPHSRRVLWIGRISPEKRLELLLDVAALLPQFQFDVVGDANEDGPYAQSLRQRAKSIENVVLHGRLDWHRVLGMYGTCDALCCTSAYEGFPNTFLEAWSRGIPVASTFDPDGVIARERLGLVAHDAGSMATALKQLHDDTVLWANTSRRARHYVANRHAADRVLPILEGIIAALLPSSTADTVGSTYPVFAGARPEPLQPLASPGTRQF